MPLKNNTLNNESSGIYISSGNNSFTDAQTTLLTMDGISFLSGNSGYSDVYGTSVFCGYNSGNYANSGDHATAIGVNTLSNSTGSTKCTALGYDALGQATLNDRVVAIGAQAGYNYTSTESNCVAIANMGVAADANVIRIGTSAIPASLSLSYISGYASGGTFEVFANYTIEGYPYFATSQRSADHSCDILKFDGTSVSLVAYSDYSTNGWESGFSWMHYQNKIYLAQSIIYTNSGPYIAVSEFTGTSLVEKDTLVQSGDLIATYVQWVIVDGIAYLITSTYFSPGASIYMFTGEKLVKILDFSLSNTNVSQCQWFSLGGILYAVVITDEITIRVHTFNGTSVNLVANYSLSGTIPNQPLVYKNKAYWMYWNNSSAINIVSFDGASFTLATTFSTSDARNPNWGYLNGEPIIAYCDSASNIFLRQFTGSSSTQILTQNFSGTSLQRPQIFEMDGISYLALSGTSLGPSNNETFAVYSITGTAAIPGHTSCYISGISSSTITGSAVYVGSDDQLGVASSSLRHKSDISDMPDMGSIIDNLRPITFTYNADASPKPLNYGLIAEEVAKIWPEMVGHKEGLPDNLYYQFLAPILLKEIQTLRKRITALEEKCNE